MKAILVIDMPSCCVACPFFEFINGDDPDDCRTHCIIKLELINDYGAEVRPKRCPLKPMPKFKINEKRVEFLNMTEREKHFYELGHDDASDEFYEEIEK